MLDLEFATFNLKTFSVACLNVAPEYADVDCSGSTAVSDVMLTILSALKSPSAHFSIRMSVVVPMRRAGPFCMNCETDWSLISDSLLTKLELLQARLPRLWRWSGRSMELKSAGIRWRPVIFPRDGDRRMAAPTLGLGQGTGLPYINGMEKGGAGRL